MTIFAQSTTRNYFEMVAELNEVRLTEWCGSVVDDVVTRVQSSVWRG